MHEDRRHIFVLGEDRPDIDLIGREQELVDIEEGDPPRIGPVAPHTVIVGRHLHCFSGPGNQCHKAFVDPGPQHISEIVGTFVLIEVEMRDANAAVKGKPFVEMSSFVLEDGANRQIVGLCSRNGAVTKPGTKGERRTQYLFDKTDRLPLAELPQWSFQLCVHQINMITRSAPAAAWPRPAPCRTCSRASTTRPSRPARALCPCDAHSRRPARG